MDHGLVRLHILVDTSSVEVFTDRGQVVLTDQVFPDPSASQRPEQPQVRAGLGVPCTASRKRSVCACIASIVPSAAAALKTNPGASATD